MDEVAAQDTTRVKVIIERGEEGYIAYPLGMKGVVVGQGDSYEEVLADVRSAIRAHVEQFGPDVFTSDDPSREAFVAEAEIPSLPKPR